MKLISHDKEASTAVVEIHGKQKTLKTSPVYDRSEDGSDAHIYVYGIALKYTSGSKIWNGAFTYWFKSGNINGVNMEHRARHASVSVVGFYEDAPQSIRSAR